MKGFIEVNTGKGKVLVYVANICQIYISSDATVAFELTNGSRFHAEESYESIKSKIAEATSQS